MVGFIFVAGLLGIIALRVVGLEDIDFVELKTTLIMGMVYFAYLDIMGKLNKLKDKIR